MSSDLLRRAAAKLREVAANATAGPWSASPVRSPDAHVTSAVYSHAHPTGSAESEVVHSVRKGQGGIRRAGNAVYFELMHPPVALALADWLDFAASIAGPIASGVPNYAVVVARAVLREDGESA